MNYKKFVIFEGNNVLTVLSIPETDQLVLPKHITSIHKIEVPLNQVINAGDKININCNKVTVLKDEVKKIVKKPWYWPF